MENRAIKHAARRDDVMVRAIMRIWKAHERGKLMTRVRAMRLLKQAWGVWKRRMEEYREREGTLVCAYSLTSTERPFRNGPFVLFPIVLHHGCFRIETVAERASVTPERAILRGSLPSSTITVQDATDMASRA